MTKYVIHDQKLIDALRENEIGCILTDFPWFDVDLALDHGESDSLPDGTEIVMYGTGLSILGRDFPFADRPDSWYRDTQEIMHKELPALIREAGWMCEPMGSTFDKTETYMVNFYVGLDHEVLSLSPTLTVHVKRGVLVRKR